ncbi:conserved hypothetical protein [uncultured Desulfobacterium sp.]|uniref:Transglycosylase SLT domain-containing protein n=1 Tax=uncultured Desulfobacterium sp. TaxID=201089 RepID=A0A445MWI5_9BACT|nr:conserved hypothetical protein [uncultured Desulfobacterium sp.]
MFQNNQIASSFRPLCLFVILLWPTLCFGTTETVSLPVTVDYPFLRSLVIYQYYTLPGQKAMPAQVDDGCTTVELSEPKISAQDGIIRFENRIKISLGAPVLSRCTRLMGWEGYLEVLQKVKLDHNTSTISFQTIESRLYNLNRARTTIATAMWNMVEANVLPFLDKTTVDLSMPLDELKGFLPLLFSADDKTRVEKWLQTLRPRQLRIDEDAIRLDLLMDVELLDQPKDTVEAPTPEEIERLSRTWETWDAYLVYQIQSLMGKPLTRDERADILETVLETRHGFIAALTENTLGRNLVGEQFIWSWERITGLLRKYLVQDMSGSPMYYLAFISSSDALAVLQKIGPSIGLDISREGLVRLAKMISQGKAEPMLEYSYAIDPGLRTLLGFGPPLDESGPAFDIQELEIPEEKNEDTNTNQVSNWPAFLVSCACAGVAPPEKLEAIKPWIPSDEKDYWDRVKQVIELAVVSTLAKNRHEEKDYPYFRLLCLATAWQESCWRQFIKEGSKVRYVISCNNTSVGLMQVNERVWRGVYKPENLRWNIEYNARAGTEVLELYLQKYALKKMDKKNPLDHDTLCRAVYAMYYAGPGGFNKFLNRNKTKTYIRPDELFWEKYVLVKEGQFEKVAEISSH